MKAAYLAVLAAVFFFATGCAGNVFYVDSRFTDAEEAELQAASDMWVEAGAEPLDFVWGVKTVRLEDDRNQVIRATEREAMYLHEDFRDVDVSGVMRRYTGVTSSKTIILNIDRIDEGMFLRTAAHEVGHTHLGHGVHAKHPGTVMYYAADSDVLTAEDKHLLVLARQP